MRDKLSREEFIALRKADIAEFKENWNRESGRFKGGWVPHGEFFMTSAILHELARAGVILDDGAGRYRPRW